MRKLVFSFVAIAAITCIFISGTEKKKDVSGVVARISSLYLQREHSLDSFLADYPHYFYDSSFTVRERKYEDLAYYFKSGTSFVLYFEPGIYYGKLISPFQFAKNGQSGFMGVLPDGWLFQGPIGNENDSTLHKDYSKQDSLSQIVFISNATGRYRKALGESRLEERLKQMDEPMLFDALRTEIFRISTIDIANSD
ncbi:MAG: hypothetical protein JST39_14375, partial [Bacteroidetes bacterium]|nr:hypothetical protein [Bacteroidota bacterium]